jgi:hypothetical protein
MSDLLYTLIVLPNDITMAREKRLNIRVTEQEWERLKAYAETQQLKMAEVIRLHINSLPKPKS